MKSIGELLDFYYAGLQQKSGWEPVIDENFQFIGGKNMSEAPVLGRTSYVQIMNRFYPLFAAMRVKDRVIEGDRAYVRTNYDYSFPNGNKASADVIEVWTARDGKLISRTTFNDTYSIDRMMK